MPVAVLDGASVAGDVLIATGVGGRWVSEVGGPASSGYPCGACTIPRSDLTVSWANPIAGDGSAALVYSASPATVWLSACTQQLLFQPVLHGGPGGVPGDVLPLRVVPERPESVCVEPPR